MVIYFIFVVFVVFFFTPGGDKSYIRSSEGERGKVYIVYVFNHSLTSVNYTLRSLLKLRLAFR